LRYHVHPNVHAQWGDQSLYFLFFTFRLSYDGHALSEALDGALEQHEVTAQVSYELLGRFDLMLRVWLSPVRLRAFRATLKEVLVPLSLENELLISVSSVVRHWPWGSEGEQHDRRGPIRTPDQMLLDDGPSQGTLHQLNDVTSGDAASVAPEVYNDLIGKRLLVGLPDEPNPGIKLVTIVAGSGLSTQEIDALQGLIARRLDHADSETFSERSLYRSESNETPFVIMCRVAPGRWDSINSAFFEQIGEVLLGKARTSTYVVVRQGVVPSSDAISKRLPSATRAKRPPIEALLADDESETLEIKATAFGAIDPWIHGRGEIVESDKLFDRSVLKSVVALLNGTGGTVVIGALEAERYRGLSGTVDETLAAYPTSGQYVCIGLLDPFYIANGWDKYQRRIEDTLDSRISDTPAATRAVIIEKATHLDREFCLIHVDAPPDDHWYYTVGTDQTRFYVRSGARVIELQGADADQYKRTMLAERARDRAGNGTLRVG
jgi:hypothetical protein